MPLPASKLQELKTKLPLDWDYFGCGPDECLISDEDALLDEARMEEMLGKIYEPQILNEEAIDEIDDEMIEEVLFPHEEVERERELAIASGAGSDWELSSSELVEIDDQGTPLEIGGADFVFVDEVRCNGCGLCSSIARHTFFAESDKGKGRAFLQGGDDKPIIEEARLACPTGAIKSVSFEELKSAEFARSTQQRQLPTCAGTSCPDAGCYNCPQYANKGDNPVYKEREAKRALKRRQHRAVQLNEFFTKEKRIVELM